MTKSDGWVTRLSRPPRVHKPVCFDGTIDAAIRQIGPDATDWAVSVGYDVAVRCIEEMPDLGGSDGAVDMLRLGTESSTIRTLMAIDAGELGIQGATDEVVVQMRDYVHRGIGIDRVWAAIRLGHSWLSETFIAACRELVAPEDQPDQLAAVSRFLFEFVNPFSMGVGQAYTLEYERWVSSASAARDEAVRAILAGDHVDTAAASRTLRYDLEHRHHLGLLIWRADREVTPTTAMHQVADSLLKAVGATHTLTVPVGQSFLWAWGGAATVFTPNMQLAGRVDTSGHHASIGAVAPGIDGFRRTHRQAVEAARVARLSRVPNGITPFDDIALVGLLTSNVTESKEFMHRELGALAGDAPNIRDLRDTLLAYLYSQRSPLATASKLFIARNTVTYRVKRAEDLIGHSLDEREPEVWMALKIADALGTVDEPTGSDQVTEGKSSAELQSPSSRPSHQT